MSVAVLLVILLVGFALIGVELFITPGFIIGIIGMLLLAAGIFFSYRDHGTVAGHITLVSVLVLLILGVVFTLRSGFWKRLALQDVIYSKVNDQSSFLPDVGAEGVTLSAIRPSGSALINDTKYEVQSLGEYIDSNTDIIVSQLKNNKIIVKQKI